jgi:hypothetical protein
VLGVGLLVVCYLWQVRSDAQAHTIFIKGIIPIVKRLAEEHPLVIVGVVLAAAAMEFRVTTLDYMAFRIQAAGYPPVRKGIFGNERELSSRYAEAFGDDLIARTPQLFGATSVIIMIVTGFGLVFSSR